MTIGEICRRWRRAMLWDIRSSLRDEATQWLCVGNGELKHLERSVMLRPGRVFGVASIEIKGVELRLPLLWRLSLSVAAQRARITIAWDRGGAIAKEPVPVFVTCFDCCCPKAK